METKRSSLPRRKFLRGIPWGVVVTACCLLSATPVRLVAASPTIQPASPSLVGFVQASDGTPIDQATITLRGNSVTRTATSDRAGVFHLDMLLPGQYLLFAFARGFAPLADRTVNIVAGRESNISLVLSVAQASSLVVLGRVTVNGGGALSTAPAPSAEINAPLAAARGVTRVSDALSDALSTTVIPVLGGGFNAPAVVALRGPDPSETLVAIDGHQVNNGNTGDYDLSLLDPADLQNVQIIYGIAPSSLVGPNTLGGAINIRTLEPTTTAHSLLRLTAGSYDTTGETVQATGMNGRIGYALSYHRLTSGGELNNFSVADSAGQESVIGNGLDATSTLAKLRYSIDAGAGFVGFTFRDQAVYRDLSAALTSMTGSDQSGNPAYDSFAGSAALSHNAAYGLDVQLPLGIAHDSAAASTTVLFRHLTSLVSQSVQGPAIGTSPYLLSGRDAIDDDTLELTHPLPDGSLSLKLAFTMENLATDYSPDAVSPQDAARHPVGDGGASMLQSSAAISHLTLGQTERSIGFRYALDPTPKLHYTFAAYYSSYSAFGRSLDPRLGFVWTPHADSALRISIGSTFQSPQLPSLFVPNPLPPPVGGYVSVGNPNLTADRSTEYDVGYEHLFGTGTRQMHLGLDLYRSDLHNGIAIYFPKATCTSVPSPVCLSYPINVAHQVYSGIEMQDEMQLGQRLSLRATYGVDSVYTASFPASTQDGTIVAGEQLLGVPLHKATFSVDQNVGDKLDCSAAVLYEGSYNELNRGPFATLRAGITAHIRSFDVGVYGSNLTNVYDAKVTIARGGVPYGAVDGPIPTNAYALPGRTLIFAVTKQT